MKNQFNELRRVFFGSLLTWAQKVRGLMARRPALQYQPVKSDRIDRTKVLAFAIVSGFVGTQSAKAVEDSQIDIASQWSVVGVIAESNENNQSQKGIAVIKNLGDSKTYTVKIGDYLPQTAYKVESIKRKQVIINDSKSKITISHIAAPRPKDSEMQLRTKFAEMYLREFDEKYGDEDNEKSYGSRQYPQDDGYRSRVIGFDNEENQNAENLSNDDGPDEEEATYRKRTYNDSSEGEAYEVHYNNFAPDEELEADRDMESASATDKEMARMLKKLRQQRQRKRLEQLGREEGLDQVGH